MLWETSNAIALHEDVARVGDDEVGIPVELQEGKRTAGALGHLATATLEGHAGLIALDGIAPPRL